MNTKVEYVMPSLEVIDIMTEGCVLSGSGEASGQIPGDGGYDD